jgi:hypothetical protein
VNARVTHKGKARLAFWLAFPLLFILGVATGLLIAGYVWSKSRYEYFPSEIVIKPPLPNATWCFPNSSLRGAENLRTELAGRLQEGEVSADSALVSSTIKQHNDSTDAYRLVLLKTHGTRYEVLSQGISEGDLTLATEEGSYYLHRIPERFHEKYDSLLAIRR